MTSTQVTALVARREVVERVRTRSFRIGTVVLVVMALAGVIVPGLAGDDDEGRVGYDVGLVGRGPASMEAALRAAGDAADADVAPRRLPDEPAAAAALRAGQIDVALVDEDRLLVREQGSERLLLLVNRALAEARLQDRLAAAGVGPAEVAGLLRRAPLPVEELEPPSTREDSRGVAFAGVLFTYFMLLTYGAVMANAVVEEKSSRVSEVLLGAVRPHQLLAGKVVGVGLVALLQLLAVGIPVVTAALALDTLHLPEGTPLTFASIFLWVVLGYSVYSCAYAAAGATASRPEEVANVTLPITLVIGISYFISFPAMADPDNVVARVASFVPPLAPMTMMPRAAIGQVARWEVPLSVTLAVIFTYALVRLAGRVYTGAILRTGARVKLREAWRAASG